MRVSLAWLHEYLELPDLGADRLAGTLAGIGIEVEAVGRPLESVLVGRIEHLEALAGSRRLQLAVVASGAKSLTAVTAATNVKVGDLVPVAPLGARLPNGITIAERQFMGIRSQAMMCSAAELEIGVDGDGIMVLDPDAIVGQPLSELYRESAVLDLSIASNRADCMGHLAVARELAVALGSELRVPQPEVRFTPSAAVEVLVEDPGLCQRYRAVVLRQVRIGPSPNWLQQRLRSIGQRPINNVVDVTNYVLQETAQPLHAFDLGRLAGRQISVRRARAGEHLSCLDGVERELTPDILTICDASGPIALAGIMGGQATAVDERTTDVLLEIANFHGPTIRTGAKRLALRTEASSRFERQLSPVLVEWASLRAAQMILELTGGSAAEGPTEVYAKPVEPCLIDLDPSLVSTKLGLEVADDHSRQILSRLGCRIDSTGRPWKVVAPCERLDLSLPEDLVEEVGRFHGYDKIQARLPGRDQSTWSPAPSRDPKWDLFAILCGSGFHQAITDAFSSRSLLDSLGFATESILLPLNPVSEALDAMRPSLLPELLRAVVRNHRRGQRSVRLFELGEVFGRMAGTGRPREAARIALVWSEAGGPPSMPSLPSMVEHVKAVVSQAALEVGERLRLTPGRHPLLHPGRCLDLGTAAGSIGHLGQLDPKAARILELDATVVVCELDADSLLRPRPTRHYAQLPRQPAIERDLAVVVEDRIMISQVVDMIRQSGGSLLEEVTLFDEYRGDQLAQGKKSLGFSMLFRSPDRTLTDTEVNAVVEAICERIGESLGARVRS